MSSVPTGTSTPVDPAHGLRDSLRQWHAAPANPDQRQIGCAAAFLHDFMGQALQGAVDLRGRHQLIFFDDAHSGEHPSTVPARSEAGAYPCGSSVQPTRACPRAAVAACHPVVLRLLPFPFASRPAKLRPVSILDAVDLTVEIGALRLANPVIAASGTFGYGIEFARSHRPQPAWRNRGERPLARAHGRRASPTAGAHALQG